MPIFELDTGRPRVLQPMRPAAGTFDSDSAALVAEHLVDLLGEPLFPVAAREGGADSPHLLAVDAAGQPVVVEVVQVLDSAALTRSLRYAGTAARMSSVDLARAYRSGPDDFAADLVAFREGVPVAQAHAAARHGGARLFVLCSEVAENVVDAVEFLRGPGRRVDVLQLGVVRGADGRRYAEVSPLVASVPARRAVEPSTLRVLPHTGAHPVVAGDAPSGDDPVTGSDRERVVGALAPAGTFPSVLPVPVGPVADEAPAGVDVPLPDEDRVGLDAPPPDEDRVGLDAAPPDEAPAGLDAPAPDEERVVPDPGPPGEVPPTGDVADAGRTTPEEAGPVGEVPPAVGVPSDDQETDDEDTDGQVMDDPETDGQDTDDRDTDGQETDGQDTEGPAAAEQPAEQPAGAAPGGEQEEPGGPPDPLPALAALAGRLGAPSTLVWRRLRRGQRFVLTLRDDGLLELPDGTVLADPDQAATTVADAESPLDGWRAWRVGDDGPALADAVEA